MAAPADGPAFEVTLQPSGWRFRSVPGLSVLQGALRAGATMAASCRNGSCRACRCRLLAGEVRYLVDWPGLLAEEKDDGWILPCVAVPACDLVIDAPAARPPAA